MSIGLELNTSTRKNGEVEVKDVTNLILYEQLSDDDMLFIYHKLLENDGVVKIMEEVFSLIGDLDDDEYQFDDFEDENFIPMITG